jgi:hypothetical protein
LLERPIISGHRTFPKDKWSLYYHLSDRKFKERTLNFPEYWHISALFVGF